MRDMDAGVLSFSEADAVIGPICDAVGEVVAALRLPA
jgi:hypothetical protein